MAQPSLTALASAFARAMADAGVADRAAVVAFFTLLSLLPALVSLLSAVTWLDLTDQVVRLERLLGEALPPAVADPMLQELDTLTTPTGSVPRVIVAFVLAWASASRALAAALRGVSRAHGGPGGIGHTSVRLWGLALTAAAILAVALLLFVLALGDRVVERLVQLEVLDLGWSPLLAWGRWPLALLLAHTLLNLLLRAGEPRRPGRWRAWSAGSLAAMVAWLAVTAGFQAYMDLMALLGAAYGGLGAAAGLLLYFHASAVALLAGAELDAALLREGRDRAPV